jgi:hypothetical protein
MLCMPFPIQVCTFENSNESLQCAMCETLLPAATAAQAAADPAVESLVSGVSGVLV